MADGQIITVFAAKGGCGKTTLATNLAVVLHATGNRRVCLVDLDLEYGDVSSMLGLAPDRSVMDALTFDGELGPVRLSALMTTFRPGLDCLLAPASPGDSQRIPAKLVGNVLTALPSVYDYVVVDTESHFSTHVLAALDAAHHLVLLTTLERPALANLRTTLDMLDVLTGHQGTRSIVVNRSDPRVDLPAAEVEALIKNPIAGSLPLRWEIPGSINQGVPLASADPHHVFSQAVRRLAGELVAAGHR
jgi:pilus assembly protein CpaE